MSREITRNKMFSKKDDEKKKKKEEKDRVGLEIKERNKEIEELDVLLDKETRRLHDPNNRKKQQEVTTQLKQDHNKVNIDIKIAESRIQDLDGLKKLTLD